MSTNILLSCSTLSMLCVQLSRLTELCVAWSRLLLDLNCSDAFNMLVRDWARWRFLLLCFITSGVMYQNTKCVVLNLWVDLSLLACILGNLSECCPVLERGLPLTSGAHYKALKVHCCAYVSEYGMRWLQHVPMGRWSTHSVLEEWMDGV